MEQERRNSYGIRWTSPPRLTKSLVERATQNLFWMSPARRKECSLSAWRLALGAWRLALGAWRLALKCSGFLSVNMGTILRFSTLKLSPTFFLLSEDENI